MKAIDVSQDKMCNALREHIKSLKNKYWLEFFNRYEPIVSKLTSYGKKILLNELNKDLVTLDFTVSNAYAVTVWAIKQSNILYDDQIVDLMKRLLTYANIELYKSNKRTFDEEEWRYNRGDIKQNLNNYYLNLDLRIVLKNSANLKATNYIANDCFDYKNNLHERSHDLINDILTVAKNLNFAVAKESSYNKKWLAGKEQTFYFKDGTILLKARAYGNGNFHLKLNTEFLKAFNIEFGRIKKWIKNKKDVVEEMNISEKDANIYFNNNYKLTFDKILQICE